MKNPNKAHRKFAGIQWFAFATILLPHRFSVAETVALWKEWWALCKPCQEPLSNRAEGDWWSNLEEVFYAN
jgi:L-rhamnose mutarotase